MQNFASSAITRKSQASAELEAGADGVTLYRCDRHESRIAQPGIPGLETRDGLIETGIVRARVRLFAWHASGAEHAQVDPGAKGRPRAADDDHPHRVGYRGADPREAAPHAGSHRIPALWPGQRDGRDAPGNAQLKSGPGKVNQVSSHGPTKASVAGRGTAARKPPGQALAFALPLVAPPRPRRETPLSLRIRWMNP